MKKLDKNELTLLGDSFLNLAQATGVYRIQNYQKLSPKMKVRIRKYHKNLIDYADTFYAESASFIVADATTSIAHIQEISTGMKDTLRKVKKVQYVLHTIGAATRLGASIVSRQPIAIVESLKDFIVSFEKLKGKTVLK